jgi:hypothetical protein
MFPHATPVKAVDINSRLQCSATKGRITMDHATARSFFTRERKPNLHGQAIRNDTNKIATDISTLVDFVFGHLPAVYESQCPPPYDEPSSINKTTLPSENWIAWQLYNEFYSSPNLKRGNDGVSVSDIDFLKTLTTFTGAKKRNRLFFLQGDIGCGKTSYINYLITKYGTSCFSDGDVWFLRVNIDVNSFSDGDNYDAFFKLTLQKLSSIISTVSTRRTDDIPGQTQTLAATKELIETTISNSPDRSTLFETLKNSISSVSSALKKSPLLIFDNLDYFFHENDRYLFLSDVDTGEKQYIETIQGIVNSFYHGSGAYFSNLGANVLFVIRPDSYELLKASKHLFQGTENCFKDDRALFSLQMPNWADVVHGRGQLLKKSISAIKKGGLKSRAESSLKDVVTVLAMHGRVNRLIQHLRHLSPFGLRSVMDFFRAYIWLSEADGLNNDIATTRYIEHYPVGLMAFMLGNKRLYSQKISGFPNIFLTNIEADEEHYIKNDVIQNLSGYKNFDKEHSNSYWLKWLILNFIQNRKRNGESINTVDLIDVFAYEQHGYYHESLVRLCLGSFAETHGSNLIKVNRYLSNDKKRLVVENIGLTERAIHCIDNIFNRFFYLQLVVDDYALPLPRSSNKETFSYANDVHYGYLVQNDDQYQAASKKMITFKARQVTQFVAILSASLQKEREVFFKTFDRLEQEQCELPNTELLFSGLLEEFSALNKFLGTPDETIISLTDMEAFFDEQTALYCDFYGGI